MRKLSLYTYRNLETGLVRTFICPPARGRWVLVRIRRAALSARTEDKDG